MRGVRREHELVVRAALGAGTARLRRLLLAENLVLALCGRGARPRAGSARRRAARLAGRTVFATRQRDPARRHGARVHAHGDASWSRCCSPSRRAWPRKASSARGSRPGSTRIERQPAPAAAAARRSSSRRSPCRWCCSTGAGLLTRTMLRAVRGGHGPERAEVLTMEVPCPLDRGRTPRRRRCTTG